MKVVFTVVFMWYWMSWLPAADVPDVDMAPASEDTPAPAAPGEAEEAPAAAGRTAAALPPGFVVTVPPGSGADDDALRSATHAKGVGLIRLQAGTYTINSALELPVPLYGAGVGKTILHYAEPTKPRQVRKGEPTTPTAVVLVKGGAMQELTIEVAWPDAIAVKVATGSSLRDVAVRGPASGTGIVVSARFWAEHVRIDGFARGLLVSDQLALAVGDGISCTGQVEAGVVVEAGTLSLRHLSANGSGAAIDARTGTLTTVLGAEVVGMPVFRGAAGAAAALSDISTTGSTAIEALGAPAGSKVDWWATQSQPAAARPLGLPIDEPSSPIPDPLLDGSSDGVALLTDYQPVPATVVSWGKPIPMNDWGPALQQAIDSGKPVVVLPPGKHYFMQGEVIIRGKVRLIDGLGGGLHEIYHGSGDLYRCALVLGDGNSDCVELRGLHLGKANCTIEQRSTRALLLRDVRGATYRGTGTGPLHAVNCDFESMTFAAGQHAWLRAVEIRSGRGTALTNAGADVWGLGVSTWHWTTVIDALGGRSELLGSLVCAGTLRPKEPLVRCGTGAEAAFGGAEVSEFSAPYDRLLVDAAGAVMVARGAFAFGSAVGDSVPGLEQAPGSLIPLLRH